jgi:hypothetical protein
MDGVKNVLTVIIAGILPSFTINSRTEYRLIRFMTAQYTERTQCWARRTTRSSAKN